MSTRDRLRRLKDKTGLTFAQLAEIFGVSMVTVYFWNNGRRVIPSDCLGTLLRLEAENLPKLAPRLNPSTIQAFYEGRKRLA